MIVGQSVANSLDGRPVIEVHDARRVDDGHVLKGTASVLEGTLIIEVLQDGRRPERTTLQLEEGAPGRASWTYPVTGLASQVRLSEPSMEEDAGAPEERSVTIELR